MDHYKFVDGIPEKWFGYASRRGISAETLLDIFFTSDLVTIDDESLEKISPTGVAYESDYNNLLLCQQAIRQRIKNARCPSATELLDYAAKTPPSNAHRTHMEEHLNWCTRCMSDIRQLVGHEVGGK